MKRIFLLLIVLVSLPLNAMANEKITVILDWYLNPDHASLIVAQEYGMFEEQGLDVEMIAPSDPTMGTRLVAAGRADLAISYQQQLYHFREMGIPLVRVGSLIETPLNTLMALPQSGIKTPADLKGKKIGFSINGIEAALLGTMLKQQGLTLADVEMVNVNFNLVSTLLVHQVDAIIGGYRNVEGNEIREQGIEPVIMKVEDYGVPPYDELVILARKQDASYEKYRKFLQALAKGAAYLKQHPQQTWEKFTQSHPELDNDLNHHIWMETTPLFSDEPARLDRKKYEDYGRFLFENGIIKQQYNVDDYAVDLTVSDQ